MRRAVLLAIAAVVLPVLGTVGGIAVQEVALAGATRWRIPITGYDPRDPLRGRYIVFRYDWAARGDPASCWSDAGCRLCLEDRGARVEAVPAGAACVAPVDPRASGLSVLSNAGRITAGTRLWVSERRAPVLEAQLRNRPMVAVARLTDDGRLIAERIEPAR